MALAAPADLSVRDLRFRYGNETAALCGVSFEVAAGECVALIGPNGAGKSTLLLHLNGLLRGSGQIIVAGMEVGIAPIREIRRRVGLVFQDPDDQLFMASCIEDVAFGPLNLGLSWPEARAFALEALGAVEMADHANRAPHHLSMGQRKRVAIATVLSMQPNLLALDEPTAGLDPRARRNLMALLDNLPQTRLIATHDLSMARDLCPRTILLDAGLVAADGPTSDILSDAKLLELHGL